MKIYPSALPACVPNEEAVGDHCINEIVFSICLKTAALPARVVRKNTTCDCGR